MRLEQELALGDDVAEVPEVAGVLLAPVGGVDGGEVADLRAFGAGGNRGEAVGPHEVLLEDADEPQRVLDKGLAVAELLQHLESRHLRQHATHQRLLFEAVHQAEGGNAVEVAVGGEDPGGEGVEGADPRLVVRRGVQRVDAPLEVGGGVVGEGEEQDLAGPEAVLLEEAEVHGDDRRGLAGARASDDAQRGLVHAVEGAPLVVVQGGGSGGGCAVHGREHANPTRQLSVSRVANAANS